MTYILIFDKILLEVSFLNNWICNNEYSFNNKDFCKIFDFYVLKTPVNDVSQRGITFKQRKFRDANEVLNNMKKIVPKLFLIYNCIDKNENLEEQLKMNGIFNHLEHPFEYAIFKRHDKLGKTESFFYYIRCALAHGSFCIHKYENSTFYYLENTYKEKGKHSITLNARMILKEDTLLKIIDLCNSRI